MFKQMSILVLEDDEDLNNDLTQQLVEQGHKVYSALNLQQARGYAFTKKIDILVGDLKLTDGDIKGFFKELKSQNIKFKRTIIMSGDVSGLKKQQGEADKKTFILEKPFSEEDLLEKIQQDSDSGFNSQYFMSENLELSIIGFDSRFDILEIEEEEICFYSLDDVTIEESDIQAKLSIVLGDDHHHYHLKLLVLSKSESDTEGNIYFAKIADESMETWKEIFSNRQGHQDHINDFLAKAKGT